MMKRTRVDEVQYGTRPGPGGVGGSGGGGPAIVTATVNTVVSASGAHAPVGGATLGISTGTIGHHRILTPQHGGAQTIAYLPSTTPTSVTNLKTTTTSGNIADSSVTVGMPQQLGGGAVVSAAQTVQYSTSYVSSISANSGTLKSTPDGTVQIHVTGGGASNVAQNNSMRQRTMSTTQNVANSLSNAPQIVQQQQAPPVSVTNPQQPQQGPNAVGQPGAPPRLKVEDALSYLDQVKFQYADQPQIYNNFLDIMKEFKSHCIDTPGVIQRVSTLFKGHTELIYGFNMFLPPGYKIEIHSDELGCSIPVVSMPSPPGAAPGSGTVHSLIGGGPIQTTQQPHKVVQPTVALHPLQGGGGAVNLMTHGGASLSQTTIHPLQPSVPQQSPGPTHVANAGSSPAATGGIVQSVTVAPVTASHVPQNYSRDRERVTLTQTASVGGGGTSVVVAGPPTPNSLSELNSPQSAVSGGSHHNLHHISQAHQSLLMGENAAGQQNQPVEFNHAITYVNKIKHRFQNQPEKYKKFLEILHTYQKEQKVIKEGTLNQGKTLTEQEVYTQVAKLFGQDEDLLREFGQFLPDATNHQTSQYMSKSHNDHKRSGSNMLSGTALSAHITMSPAAGSPLHLSSGATLSQIGSSPHAAALGNLSAVNTSVSIKSYNNVSQPNHVINTAGSGGGRGDIIFEKDYHAGGLQQQQQQQQQQHQATHLIGPSGAHHTLSLNSLRGYEKDIHHRNHHVLGQKYLTGPVGASALSGSPAGGHASKKSPSYSHQMQSGIGGTVQPMGASMTYTGAHQHLSGARRHAVDDNLSGIGAPPAKRHRPICRDITFAEASRQCSIADAAYFDKVRKALRSPEVYNNFLRCLTLFNQEIISKAELLGLVTPFLSKFPEYLRWFSDFLGPSVSQVGGAGNIGNNAMHGVHLEGIPLQAAQRHSSSNSSSNDRHTNLQSSGDLAQEIDLSSCKRLGASYCALPQATIPKKCSGRTALCREVLNDKWVSFPTWASEDSTFVTSRKTQFEETIYRNIHRTEDERFELDVVIETNSATIRVLEGVQKKLARMASEELARYHLDDYLGGTSQTIHQRAIFRIYGDKAGEIIQGLKKNPAVAVPIVLKRLKVKEEEWREAQKNFNKQWREQNEKYYLKSLDHQAINFKPNDMKALRSKSLFNDIETMYDERHDQDDENGEAASGPHLILPYKDKTILDDAANLLIHHVKRQTGIQKQEKTKIKHILRQFVPDLFFTSRQPLSDDERDDDDSDKVDVDTSTSNSVQMTKSKVTTTAATSTSTAAATTTTAAGGSADIKSEIIDNTTANLSLLNHSKESTIQSICATGTTEKIVTAVTTTSSESIIKNQINNCAVGGKPITAATAVNVATTTTDAASSSSASVVNTTNIESKSDIATSSSAPTSTTGAASDSVTSMQIDTIKIEKKDEDMKPLVTEILVPPHAIGEILEETYTLFFANNNWYLFLRLHAILCERLRTMYERAQILAAEELRSREKRRENTATALRLKPRAEVPVEDYYPSFLDMLKSVLDGNMDSNTFEDSMREMFGIHAYISFTLDKVVSNAVRQLQNCVTERGAVECVELFTNEQRRTSGGIYCRNAPKHFAAEMAYQRKAEQSLHEENCFKVYIYKIDCRVTIELLDSESDELEKPVNKSWNKYVEGLINPGTSAASTANSVASSATSSAAAATADSASTDIKSEHEEDAIMVDLQMPHKARFLKRNARNALLRTEQMRQQQLSADVTANTAATSMTTDGTGGSGINSTTNATKITLTPEESYWRNKRPPERLGTLVGIAEKYHINDRDEIKINAAGRQVFVINKNLKFFKLDAVRRARNSHLHVTQRKHERFQKFTQKWLGTHVSELQQQQCNDWLLGKTVSEIQTEDTATTTAAPAAAETKQITTIISPITTTIQPILSATATTTAATITVISGTTTTAATTTTVTTAPIAAPVATTTAVVTTTNTGTSQVSTILITSPNSQPATPLVLSPPPKTKVVLQNDLLKTPYRAYNRYKVSQDAATTKATTTMQHCNSSAVATPTAAATGACASIAASTAAVSVTTEKLQIRPIES